MSGKGVSPVEESLQRVFRGWVSGVLSDEECRARVVEVVGEEARFGLSGSYGDPPSVAEDPRLWEEAVCVVAQAGLPTDIRVSLLDALEAGAARPLRWYRFRRELAGVIGRLSTEGRAAAPEVGAELEGWIHHGFLGEMCDRWAEEILENALANDLHEVVLSGWSTVRDDHRCVPHAVALWRRALLELEEGADEGLAARASAMLGDRRGG